MTEENVTLTIIKELKHRGWRILAFDFPQSGTGKIFFSDSGERNIPDIIAEKDGNVLFFENKDRFVFSDFTKISNFVNSNSYKKSVTDFLKNTFRIDSFVTYSAIGMPKPVKLIKKYNNNKNIVDLVMFVTSIGIEIDHKSLRVPNL